MKVYSIGREAGCDIVINDRTDVISRRHAVLNVSSSGKMTIVDQSHNGTYVNGIRIAQNVPVPVTRKDNVSLAHVARLDWNMVPNSNATLRYVLIGVAALIVIVCAIFGFNAILGGDDKPKDAMVADSARVDTLKTQEQIEKEVKQDSLKDKAKQDSIRKARNAQKPEVKTPVKPKVEPSTGGKKTPTAPKKEKPKKEETKTFR